MFRALLHRNNRRNIAAASKDTKTNSRPRLYARATIAPEGESCRRQASTALISTGKRLAKARHWSGSTSTAETCALGSHRSGTSPGVIAWSLTTIVGIRHQPSQTPPVTTPKAYSLGRLVTPDAARSHRSGIAPGTRSTEVPRAKNHDPQPLAQPGRLAGGASAPSARRGLAWFVRLQTAPDLGSLHEDRASHHRRPARPVRRRTQRLRIRGCHQSNQSGLSQSTRGGRPGHLHPARVGRRIPGVWHPRMATCAGVTHGTRPSHPKEHSR